MASLAFYAVWKVLRYACGDQTVSHRDMKLGIGTTPLLHSNKRDKHNWPDSGTVALGHISGTMSHRHKILYSFFRSFFDWIQTKKLQGFFPHRVWPKMLIFFAISTNFLAEMIFRLSMTHIIKWMPFASKFDCEVRLCIRSASSYWHRIWYTYAM